ncbi:MAG: lmo0937 family membrane protein [Allosphingosinicella sp.]
MLLTIAAILLILWLVGLLAFKSIGALIHIVLVVAIILFVIHLVTGRRAV